MKKIYILAFALLALSSCDSELDNGPLERLTDDYVFDPSDPNAFYAERVLSDIYSNLPTGFNRIGGNLLCTASDDAMPSQEGTSIEAIRFARISNAVSNPDDAWAKNYNGIREVNYFLSKIDVVNKPAQVPGWKMEARFLRAMFYFELVKRYGGVPLLGDRVLTHEDDLQIPRNTFSECIDYIVRECDAIKEGVKMEPVSVSDWGRASRGAALALKARTLLYAASPLYNNPNQAQVPNAFQGYTDYNPERWEKAAKAAKEVMDLNAYFLEATFNNVFINRRNKEVILSFLRGTTTDVETNNGPIGYSGNASGNGRTSPTQNLVDAFPMNNGKAITDPTSGYNPATPYANRDPRLGNTVLVNNANWLNRPLETFEGGRDKPNTNRVQTKTGYYMRKFMGNFATATQYSAQNHNFVLFRYAEVLLNYAEALNEFSGPSEEVYKVLKDIRKRAGIQAGADNMYGLKADMDKLKMQEAIRNERRVEMAFEEQRYWDVRRWRIAEQVLNQDLGGMRITKDAEGAFTYERVTAGKIAFISPKMYWYPIPFSETLKNRNLVQNQGW